MYTNTKYFNVRLLMFRKNHVNVLVGKLVLFPIKQAEWMFLSPYRMEIISQTRVILALIQSVSSKPFFTLLMLVF